VQSEGGLALTAERALRGGQANSVDLDPANGKDMDELVAHADGAMYAAKRSGGKRFELVGLRGANFTGPLRLPLTMHYVNEWLSRHIETDAPYAKQIVARGTGS